MRSYEDFIAGKRRIVQPDGIDVSDINPRLFPFQRAVVQWSLRRARSAVWADCGLGKSWMAIEWAHHVTTHSGLPVLILCPLAVADQFVAEGEAMGRSVVHTNDPPHSPGIYVANYERLHHFDGVEFGGIVLDESSILKDYSGKMRTALIDRFAATPFRLCCSATPSPNDHMELGNHAEFVGVLSRPEMLATYFVHDSSNTQDWRLKGHAVSDFWKWVSSWAVAFKQPAEIGFPGHWIELPPIEYQDVIAEDGSDPLADGDQGRLFHTPAASLSDFRTVRRQSADARIALAAKLANDRPPSESVVIWCETNAESVALTAAIDNAHEVTGSMSIEEKERLIAAFARGEVRRLVTKPSIAGWGVNWQECHVAIYVSPDFSFEKWYQSVRRLWRFGQQSPVTIYTVITHSTAAATTAVKRKAAQFEELTESLARSVLQYSDLGATVPDSTYSATVPMEVPQWLVSSISNRDQSGLPTTAIA